ncbi:MAG: hypothetical protein FWC82_00050 [Firmicutes bacterium]|nr:hypothetical protein [Bacillota bacterium]
MIGTHQIITHDIHDIASRLKEVDSDYFLVRNYKTKKFEIHALNQRGGTLALTLPFDRLDERTIRHARRTRGERAKDLFAEMDRQNKKLERERVEKAMKKVEKVL